jgi:hypothetical protein
MRHLVTTVAVLVAGPAFASDRGGDEREPARTQPADADPEPAPPAPIRIGSVTVDDVVRRIDRADATVHVRRGEVVVTLALTVRGRDATARIGTLSVALPPGATATGLELRADGVIGRGEARSVIDARSIFVEEVTTLKDPALLEHVATAADHTRLLLSVGPLTKEPVEVTMTVRVPRTAASAVALHVDAPMTIELAAEAGAADELVIRGRAKGTTSARAGRGTKPIVVAFRAPAGAVWSTEPVETHRAVDAETSLLALLPWERRGPTYARVAGVPWHASTRSGKDIRKVVRLHMPRVAHCYQETIQRDPAEAGTVQMSWVIRADGSVDAVVVSGAGDGALHDCIADVIAGMRFAPDDGVDTLVRYPLVLAPRWPAPPPAYPDLAADIAEYEAEQAALAAAQAPR